MTALVALAATAAGLLSAATAIMLDVNSTDSITITSANLAFDLMSWYRNNQSSTPAVAVGTLPAPFYWWEAGAVWGGMIDYWAYTNDTSYNPTVTQALLAQVGPDSNYMPPAYYASLGNDDQSFWGFACLSALEYGFPSPPDNSTSLWLDLAEALWNTQATLWDTTSCNGGLKWQKFHSNAGYDYKNSISNGAFFQISARLARYTGNQTYVDWAERTWDWMWKVGLIDNENYNVYDGTSDTQNCSALNHMLWSYNPSALLYGSAMLYNYTNGSHVWENRTNGLLAACAHDFFSPFPNASNVMYEAQCEPDGTCDDDQHSFKAYLARWMAKSAIVVPYIANAVSTLMIRSASAAAQSCSGGSSGTACGQKWYVGGHDGSYGVGQELSALETVQSLLLLRGRADTSPLYPATQKNVHIQRANVTTTTYSIPAATSRPTSAPRSVDANAAYRPRVAPSAAWCAAVMLPVVLGMVGLERGIGLL